METVHRIAMCNGYVAVIDLEVFERESYCEFKDGFVWTGRICDINWCPEVKHHTTYARSIIRCVKKERDLRLHRVVMLAGKGEVIDHRNNNGLDCVESNLRATTLVGNARNRRKLSPASSVFKGVSFHKLTGKWSAQIRYGVRKSHIGLFSTEEDAARAYDAVAIVEHGEFARLNFEIQHQAPH